MRRHGIVLGLVFLIVVIFLMPQAFVFSAAGGGNEQGQGIVIELDNQFIKDYENRVTITSKYKIVKLSAVHLPANDGEVHVGGWAYEAGLPCVAEVMNAANLGKQARLALANATNGDKEVTISGAWRIWGEHPGTAAQIQAKGTEPTFPLHGEAPSNPDHVFEIHPVTTVKVGDQTTPATGAIGDTPGFTPHDAQKAFLLGYEKLTCKIVPKDGRARIITRSLGVNFTNFVIRLNEDPVKLEDGHGAICSVYDTDGELLMRGRRMVFIKGTAADSEVAVLKKDGRLRVTGIPRISLKLIQWRLEPKNDPKYDVSPLEWHLPYEMIIVAAAPLEGNNE
jgi:hypothetical protein